MSVKSHSLLVERTYPQGRASSAYIHVPFCTHRCGYCDFTLITGRDDLISLYLQALERELQHLRQPQLLETLYLGGGTPSYFSRDQLAQLFSLLLQWFEFVPDAEITFEANPADLDDDKISLLDTVGVNRISLGVQSFNEKTLQMLERDHSPSDIPAVIAGLRKRIDNISFDLIFGVPGQTLSIWSETLTAAMALQPKHLSTYCLTYEKGTAFWSRRLQGKLQQASEDTERAMYTLVMDRLRAADYEHYEISSFAKQGYRSRHNQIYWQGRPYYGFGPGAARYLNGIRQTNHRSVTTWIKKMLSEGVAIMESEQLNPKERAIERLLLGLRQREGVVISQFAEETGFELMTLRPDVLQQYLDNGLLEIVAGRLQLSAEGVFLADTIFVDLL